MSGIHLQSQRCLLCSSTPPFVEARGHQVRASFALPASRGLPKNAAFQLRRRVSETRWEEVDLLRYLPPWCRPVNRVVVSVLEVATLTVLGAANAPQQEAVRSPGVTLEGVAKSRRPVRRGILVPVLKEQTLSGQTNKPPRQAVRSGCRTVAYAKVTRAKPHKAFGETTLQFQYEGPSSSLGPRLRQRHHSGRSYQQDSIPIRRLPPSPVQCRVWLTLAIGCSSPVAASHSPTRSVSWSPEPCEAQSYCVVFAQPADLRTYSPRLCMLGEEATGNVFYRA